MDLHENKSLFAHYELPVAMIILMAATLAIFSNALFLTDNRIISQAGTDTYSHFVYWRDFGFSQLRQGNLPLWNPHLFSGMPYFSALHSALLYPLNWIYLFLPVTKAINVSIVMHVFLIGFFMYLWTGSRGLHPAASLTAALTVMFSGANFMHVFAGHLIDICTMAWAPLIFLTIDRLMSRPSPAWHLLGIFAVSMQILAGHPQYVYYTAITAMLYTGCCLIHQDRRVAAILSIAGVYAAGIVLTAVQLMSGIEATREAVRSTGVSYAFASMFAYPPENLISLITPFLFGDIKTIPYWGRAYLWEMTFYIGLAGFLLALYGAIAGGKRTRRYSVIMVVCLVILALGKNTPVFDILYHFLPGFSMFRGASKFIFPATLFLAMLSAIGMDSLMRNGIAYKKIVFILIFIGSILLAAAFIIASPFEDSCSSNVFSKLFSFISSTNESYLPSDLYRDGDFLYNACSFASAKLLFPAAVVFALALILALTKFSRHYVYFIFILVFVEIFSFAWHVKTDFDVKDTATPDLSHFLKNHPGDYRVLNLIKPNSALVTGDNDLWGYDPGVPLRYAQFMGFTQGYDHEKASNYIKFHKTHPLFRMLRLRFIITSDQGQIKIHELRDYMSRCQLIEKWEVVTEKKALLQKMDATSFDPRKTVLLETAPGLADSVATGQGTCRIIDQSTDHLTLDVNTSRDAIVLITDSYSRGWQVAALHIGAQEAYQIMPANFTLLAVPVKAGGHRLRLEYAPWGYRIGKWVSIFALSIYLLAIIFHLQKRFRRVKIKA